MHTLCRRHALNEYSYSQSKITDFASNFFNSVLAKSVILRPFHATCIWPHNVVYMAVSHIVTKRLLLFHEVFS